MTDEERKQVAADLRRLAPIRTHALRRAYLEAAEEIEASIVSTDWVPLSQRIGRRGDRFLDFKRPVRDEPQA